MTINFNTDPYYDDYDESKNFHRILFRPGLSVQNRELIQLQTILQKQIERHGSHVFKEGAKVFGAEFTYSENLDAVKVEDLFGVEYVEDYAEELIGKTITGATSGVTATILAYTRSNNTDPLSFYVNYTSTGTDRVTTKFQNNEELTSKDAVFNYPAGSAFAKTLVTETTGVGIGASITQGVYYVKGYFVLAAPQFHIVSKYDTDFSGKIGLKIVESIVSSSEDESLLDNASGTPNFAGRGADRYVIDLVLSAVSLTDEPIDFIEIERVSYGQVLSKTRTTPYNELAKNLARRTFDINGSFVINPFRLKIKEALNNYLNNGVYNLGETSNYGNLIDNDDFAVAQISEGKAYIDGYEVESIGSKFLDIEKPRDFRTVNNSAIPMEVGNYIRVTNMEGLPDTVGAGSIISYPEIQFYDTANAVDGTPNGNMIGVGRIRSMEFDSGDESALNKLLDDTAVYKMYLFDIKMMQKISFAAHATNPTITIAPGTLLRGATSGATGYVHSYLETGTNPATNQTVIYLTSVSGVFLAAENLISNSADSATAYEIQISGTTDSAEIAAIESYSFDSVKQLYYDDPAADGEVPSTGDLVLENQFALSGTIQTVHNEVEVTGFNTKFTTELRPGDVIVIGGAERIVSGAVTISDTTLSLTDTAGTTGTAVSIRKRAFINDQEKNLSIRQLAKPYIKTLKPAGVSESSITYRKQFYATANSSGIFTINEPSSKFAIVTNDDYQITIVEGGTNPYVAGDIVNAEYLKGLGGGVSGEGTSSLVITAPLVFNNGTKVKINTTIERDTTTSKTKTAVRSAQTKILNKKATNGLKPYGTSAHHPEISLGVSDAFKLLAVYDSNSLTVDAVTPTMSFINSAGNFVAKETITGTDSGASAIILNNSSPLNYILLSSIEFLPGEIISGADASATAGTLTAGSKVVTSRYLLDTGQRDNYYDISKIVLKQRAPKPAGRLLAIYDHFDHGTGLYFDVDSYVSVDYSEIPYYSSTRIDPDATNTTGVFDLRTAIDFRPKVANTGTVTGDVRTVNENSFDFASRVYSGAGSSATPIPKDNSLFDYGFEYYLGRSDTIWLTTQGEWVTVKGEPSESPVLPEEIANAMKIADIFMSPYVLNVDDIEVEIKLQKRYRMEDIDKITQRVDNIEYHTSLSLLESSVESLQVKDSNGLDRFKSGFLVDNFGGHKTGDAAHQDYRCAIDMTNGILRPKYNTKNIELIEKTTTTPGYVVNDNIATIAYVHLSSIEQPFATRIESLTPVLTSSWIGSIALTPSADSWFENKKAPDITKNIEGNYNAVLTTNKNSLGTVWGAAQTSWTGVVSERLLSSRRSSRLDSISSVGNQITATSSVRTTSRFLQTSSSLNTQQGIRSSLVERVDTRLEGNRTIANDIIPFMRKKEITFSGSGFKPFTRVYPFFDNINVSRFVTPAGGSVVGTKVELSNIVEAGSWTTISRIQLAGFWSQQRTTANTIFSVQTSPDNINWSLANSATFGSAIEANVNTPNLTLSPNSVNGELYIRIWFNNPDHMAFNQFVVYDQAGVAIPSSRIELHNHLGWFNAQNSVKTAGYAVSNWRKIRTANMTFKIIDGPKTTIPSGGKLQTFNNDSLDATALVTDATGTVRGIFTIPDPNIIGNPKFRTGDRTLRLTSSSTNGEAGITTAGETEFTSKGILKTKQRTFVATRNATVKRESVNRSFISNVSRVTSRTTTPVTTTRTFTRTWGDPLAQSFQITTEGGEFLTKVDVFFESKDNFIPARCELREMENGLPTSRIIPNSGVSLDPEYINVSSGGTVATTFEFSAPIYVKEGIELALVLLSDSENYRVFISKLGELNLADQAVVSRQPYLGVLFKSQNSATWTAYDNEDLKFTVYRAKFDIGSTTLSLRNANIGLETLIQDPIEMFEGSNQIEVFHDDHQMHQDDNAVEIRNATSGIYSALTTVLASGGSTFGFNATAGMSGMSTTVNVMFKLYRDVTGLNINPDKVDSENRQGEIITADISEAGGIITATNLTRDIDTLQDGAIDFAIGDVIELYTFNGVNMNQINKVHPALHTYNMDSYVIELTEGTATEATQFGGNKVQSSHNALVNSYQIMVPTVVHNNTQLSTQLNLVTGTSFSGNETSFGTSISDLTNTVDMISLSNAGMIASQVNEVAKLGSNESARIDFIMTTNVDNLSPVVDLERASISTFANRLESISNELGVYPNSTYVAPTEPEGDSGESIYITKRVQLENPASALKVYLDAALLNNADIQVMYKILRSDDSVEFDEIGWVYFNGDGSPDDVVNPSSNVEEFKEYAFGADTLPEFIGFSVKIRMTGTNSSTPPLIKRLRALALAI